MAAKKKSSNVPATKAAAQVPAKIVWANMTSPDQADAPLPEYFGDNYEVESFGNLNDTVNFENPGDMCLGYYIGAKTLKLADREQTLYSFQAAEEMGGPEGYQFAVWGSRVLDDRMMQVSPKRGDKILIRFLGEGNAKAGMNAPKLYQVARLKKKS